MNTEAVILIMFFGTTLSVVIYGYRYMQNKERMAMIEKGTYSIPEKAGQHRMVMKIALMLIGGGLGLLLAFLVVNFIFSGLPDRNVVYFALTALMAGIGLFIGNVIKTKSE
ncbi:MAG: hypothetical protein JWM28_4024 [Chitinophagaceae bacterium]|nr:hypothetical protein [Chitinophagaceae bacterium]